MNCPYCQTQNRDGAKRCRNCGQVLPGAPQQPVPGQQFPQQMPPPQQMPMYPPQAPPVYPQVPGIPPAPPAQAKQSLFQKVSKKEVGLGCLLLLVGFAFGILGTVVVQSVSGSGATSTPAVAEKPDKDFRPPAFKLKTTDDKDTDFPKVLAGKAGVLVFWATDAQNDDQMNKLQAMASDTLKVFAVNSKENQATSRKYADGKGWSKITILLDSDGTVKEKYNVTDIPVYFLINKDGIITERLAGGVKPEDLGRKINDELLK